MLKSNAGVTSQAVTPTAAWTPEAIMRLSPSEFKANFAAIKASGGVP
jgi:hypothetical protein